MRVAAITDRGQGVIIGGIAASLLGASRYTADLGGVNGLISSRAIWAFLADEEMHEGGGHAGGHAGAGGLCVISLRINSARYFLAVR